jgi:hypothetical protein
MQSTEGAERETKAVAFYFRLNAIQVPRMFAVFDVHPE